MKGILTAVLACLLAGCAIGPDYQRPETRAPQTFRGQSPQPDTQSVADMAWWELYRDPVLDQLIKTALQQNYDVRIALARVEEFRAQAGIAGLGSIPLISAGAGGTRSRVTTVGPTPLPSSAKPVRSTYNADIDISYEVDLWGRISSLQSAARADLLTSEFARDTARVSVVSNVATAYFNLRSLDQQLYVTQRTAETREKFVELTRAQFKRGVVSGLDVNRAEASLATARTTALLLRSQIAQTENLLQILLGENPAPIIRPAVSDTQYFPQPPAVPLGLPATLLERRPDLRQAESTLIGANARVKAVKASLFPTISLTGSLGGQSAALSDLFIGPARTWSFGLSLLQPIIDINRNKYQVDAFSAREAQSLLQYQQIVAQAFREVSDALVAREGNMAALRVLDEQITALRAARDQVQKRYNAGYSSYFEVIDADSALFVAELTRAQIYNNTLTSLVQLYKALGGGWQAAVEPPTTGGTAAP